MGHVSPRWDAGDDHGVAGRRSIPPDPGGLCLSPQRGDLHAATPGSTSVCRRCLKWAGMAAIASHHVRLALLPLWLDRDRRVRRHPAEPGSPQVAVDQGREHDPGDEQRHLRRHLLGALRLPLGRGRSRPVARSPGERVPLRRPPLGFRVHRPGAPGAGRRLLDRRGSPQAPSGSSGTGTCSSSSTNNEPSSSPTSTACRAPSPGWCPWAPRRPSRCAELGASLAYFTSFYLSAMATRSPHLLRTMRWPRITNYDDR